MSCLGVDGVDGVDQVGLSTPGLSGFCCTQDSFSNSAYNKTRSDPAGPSPLVPDKARRVVAKILSDRLGAWSGGFLPCFGLQGSYRLDFGRNKPCPEPGGGLSDPCPGKICHAEIADFGMTLRAARVFAQLFVASPTRTGSTAASTRLNLSENPHGKSRPGMDQRVPNKKPRQRIGGRIVRAAGDDNGVPAPWGAGPEPRCHGSARVTGGSGDRPATVYCDS